MIHNPNNLQYAGRPLNEASKVMVLVHGRGGSAADMLTLSRHIRADDFAFVAPEARGNTWYPHSFMRPLADNEPALSSALEVLASLRARLQADYNFKLPQIYWLGFSQGACLLLEFLARNATQYGGIFGLSGALIGPSDTTRTDTDSFDQTPVFLGCGDPDTHIPKDRFLATEQYYRERGAAVTAKLYPDFSHAINEDEVKIVNLLIDGSI